MNGQFDLAPAEWATLRRLLGEALDRPAAVRATWVEELDAQFDVFKPRLRALLEHAARATGALALDTLPKVETAQFAPDRRADDTLRAGAAVGPYRLLRPLGKGGMGEVWLAERTDILHRRQVALKLPRLVTGRAEFGERLEREREILAALEHPNIARLYDAGVSDDGQPWMALEYVEGERIDTWVARRSPGITERLRLFGHVVQAVAHAHGRLVVHRDLKPANILVTADDQAKLLDFGIAKLLEEGVAEETALTREKGRAYTPEYASPEQVRGEALGTAADIYSLGVILFELHTGQRPPPAGSGRPPPRPSTAAGNKALRGDLDAIILKALEPESESRYATAQALAEDIERHLQGRPVQARPAHAGYLLRRFLARHALAASVTTAAVLAVLGGAGVAVWQAQVARVEARRAQAVKTFMADVLREADPFKAGNSKPTVEGLIRQARAKLGTRYADQPALRVELLTLLAGSLIGLSDFDEAESVLQQALTEGREALDAHDPLVLRARLAMTSVYRLRVQTQKLAETLGPLLAELEATPGVEPTDLIDAYENAGHLAIEQRRPADAVAAADKALALLQRHPPSDEARVVELSLLRSVALTYMSPPQLALDASSQTLRRAVALWGDERPHARVLDVRGVYGRALGNAGLYRQAADELVRVVSDTSALLGPNVPMIAFTTADIARFELDADRPDKALGFAERSTATLHNAGIDDAFSRCVPMALRGRALLALRRPQAAAVLQQAYALGAQAQGANSLTAGHIAAYLALAQARSGQLQLARKTLQAHPPPPPTVGRATAFDLQHIEGVVLRLAGDVIGARLAQNQAQGLLKPSRGDDWRRLQVQTELARLALDEGDAAPGLALASVAPLAPPAGPREAERLQVLGLALRAAGRADEAQQPLAWSEAFWQQAATGPGS